MAMNFILGLSDVDLTNIDLVFLVAKNSEPHKYLERLAKYRYFVAPRNPLLRILYERFFFRQKIKQLYIDIIYSYFGYGFFGAGIKQVSGSADSNLYFPEIDFWKDYQRLARLKKWITDKYRLFGVKRSSAVVFENEAMKTRAVKLFNIRRSKFIKPSIVIEKRKEEFIMPDKVHPDNLKGLFLCGWHHNKNVMIIPELALEFRKSGTEIQFILTAPYDSTAMRSVFLKKLNDYGVEDLVSIVGSVNKAKLESLYRQIDFVFLLSKLESFSNNIIEAWQFERPLVISDEEWSRAICRDGAIYVDRNDPAAIASSVTQLINDPTALMKIVDEGRKELQSYPTTAERIKQELQYLKEIAADV